MTHSKEYMKDFKSLSIGELEYRHVQKAIVMLDRNQISTDNSLDIKLSDLLTTR
jgi:hypothetical protein